MKLEGSLDAFSLPEILRLLTMTNKSGGLHLWHGSQHGLVRLADGAIAGASSDPTRQALVRRLVGGGHLTDAALAAGVERARADTGVGLARAVADAVDPAVLLAVAREQCVDAIFDILRWTEGDFTFLVGEADADDIGLRLPGDELVGAARQRIDAWPAMSAQISSPDVVLCLTPAPAHDPTLSRDEWALLALVDGRRTIGDLVALCGRGECAVVAVLSPLLERGLLMEAGEGAGDVAATLVRCQRLIATLETPVLAPEAAPAVLAPEAAPAVLASVPSPSTAAPLPALPVVVPRPAAPVPVVPPLSPPPLAVVADAADSAPPVRPPPVKRDESVNRSMVLRLIAGVQEL